jgi:hypothetical protein
VRDVLRHSTGMPNWRKDPANEWLVPAVAPGTRIDYSGEAFVWLQLVVRSGHRREPGPGDAAPAVRARRHARQQLWLEPRLAARSVYGHRARRMTTQPGMPAQMLREAWNAAQPVADRWGKPLSAWRYADADARCRTARAQAITPKGLVNWPSDILANSPPPACAVRCRTTRASWR